MEQLTRRTGHFPLKWGTIAFLVGYGLVLATGPGGGGFFEAVSILGNLIAVAGAITSAVGLVQRLIYNKRANNPLPFTPGEKVALIGGFLLLIGVFFINGALDDTAHVIARVLGIGGLVTMAGGAIWHLLTPRRSSAIR